VRLVGFYYKNYMETVKGKVIPLQA